MCQMCDEYEAELRRMAVTSAPASTASAVAADQRTATGPASAAPDVEPVTSNPAGLEQCQAPVR